MSILQWTKKRCLDPDSSSELFDKDDFDPTDIDQSAVEMECPPPMFELQFDAYFKSDCVTEDKVDMGKRDIENTVLARFFKCQFKNLIE